LQTTVFNIDRIAHTVITNFDKESKAIFHRLAREKLNEQIAIGNNKFSTYIDRRPSNVSYLEQARKQIRFQFIANAIKLAIRIMEEEMRRAIGETTTARTGKLKSNIQVFYGKQGAGLVSVTNLSELNDFRQGDIVFICPAQPYSGIVLHHVTQKNARARTAKHGLTKPKRTKRGLVGGGLPRRGVGFIAIAAKRIRSIIGQQPAAAGVSVLGVISQALVPLVWNGVPTKLVGRGVPCITIAYKFNQTAGVIAT